MFEMEKMFEMETMFEMVPGTKKSASEKCLDIGLKLRKTLYSYTSNARKVEPCMTRVTG
jgi:hypothetical protein